MAEKLIINSYNQYLKTKYSGPAYRVGLDAGFSCPNRGVDRSKGGCVYCDGFGARAPYLGDKNTIKDQVDKTVTFLKKRYKAEYFLLYFQAFSSTWASTDKLKEIYDYSLSLGDFSELIVSTRPDCLPPATADLLQSYKTSSFDVWVELGLQSSHPETLKAINRGHSLQDFEDGFNRIRERGLKIAVHLIFGLPGEDFSHIRKTIAYINKLKPDAVKIHNLHIPAGASLGADFLKGEVVIPGMTRHLEYCIEALSLLSPEIIIMRLTCDTPHERCSIPGEIWAKSLFYNTIRKELKTRGLFQGINQVQ